MDSNKLKGFFYPGNAESGEPDYRLAKLDLSNSNWIFLYLSMWKDFQKLEFVIKKMN